MRCTLPLVIGPWSDTFKTPMGRRRPFMLAALGPIGFCLAIVAFMPNIWTMTLIVLAFFFAYYVYEPPYRGLYPDVLHESAYGRSQGVQHVLRGIALGIALVAGGFLFKAWDPAPFLLAALATTAACGAVVLLVQEPEGEGSRVFRGVRSYVRTSWAVFHEVPEVRRFLFANAAWEGTFAAMRTFVVLYITKGLGEPLSTSSAVLATVAVGYVIAALGSWHLGNRFGLARVILAASFVYGGGLLAAGLATEWHNWYFGFDPPGRGRGRHGDDALVGSALQADARAAPRCHLGPGDDHQGNGPARRPARRWRDDRRDEAVPAPRRTATRCCGPCAPCRCWRRSRSSRR